MFSETVASVAPGSGSDWQSASNGSTSNETATVPPGGELSTAQDGLTAGIEQLVMNDTNGATTNSGMTLPTGMAGQMSGFQGPNGVDPYIYLNNISMQTGIPPQLSAHAAYMALPNNIVPNVNFLSGGAGGPQSGAFAQATMNMAPNGYMHGRNGGSTNGMPPQAGSGGIGVNPSMCKFYLQGHCARGEQCNYAHIQPKGQMIIMQQQHQPRHGRRHNNHNNNNSNNANHNANNGTNSNANGAATNGTQDGSYHPKHDRYSHHPHSNGGGRNGHGGGGGMRHHHPSNGQMRLPKGYHHGRQAPMMYGYGGTGAQNSSTRHTRHGHGHGHGHGHHPHIHPHPHPHHGPMGGMLAPTQFGDMLTIQHPSITSSTSGPQQSTSEESSNAASNSTTKTGAYEPASSGASLLTNLTTGTNGAEMAVAAAAALHNPLAAMHGFHPPHHHAHPHAHHHHPHPHPHHHGMGPMGMGPPMHGGMMPFNGDHHHHLHPHSHHPHTGADGQTHPRHPHEYAAAAAAAAEMAYGQSPMSDFLSKFSVTSSPEELTGHIYMIAKDQYGCRLLQRMLDEQKAHIVDLTFNEVFDHMNELMTDPFGNYLCQKLIEHCNEQQRFAIIQKVAPDLVAISLNMHGTRAVQKLVETISTPKETELVIGALRSSVVTLIKDLNGNHVIQRCLCGLNSKDNQFIYDAVSRHCVSVATHKHGCCVLQRTIDYATMAQKRQLVQEIIANALELVQDAFGNYVVQYVLDLGEPTIAHGIMNNLLGSISSLSVQKFSSNVVEKCLELSNEKMRVKLIEELVNPERLPRLLQDPYANYVIQKALAVSKKHQFERLVAVIKPHLIALRNTSFGKRIQSKILKKFPDLNISFDVLTEPSNEMTPIVLGAMVSGLTGMNGKRSSVSTNVSTNGSSSGVPSTATTNPSTASDEGGLDAGGSVNVAPGGMSINAMVTLPSLSPALNDPLSFLGHDDDNDNETDRVATGEQAQNTSGVENTNTKQVEAETQ